MEEDIIEGNAVKTLWLKPVENPDRKIPEGQSGAAGTADLLRIAGQKEGDFEDAIMRICQVKCKVRIEADKNK